MILDIWVFSDLALQPQAVEDRKQAFKQKLLLNIKKVTFN